MIAHVPADFTLDELLAHLRGEAEDAQELYPSKVWAERFGVSIRKMRSILAEAKEAGKLRIGKVYQNTLDDRLAPTTGYGFILENEAEKPGR